MDAIFVTDIVVNFRTGYMSRGLFVKDTKMIAQNYLHSSFTLDMVSSFPLSLILKAVTPDTSNACDPVVDPNCHESDDVVFRLNRLLRLLRLTKLLRMMKLGHCAFEHQNITRTCPHAQLAFCVHLRPQI